MRANDRPGTSRISHGARRLALVTLATQATLAAGCAGAGLSGAERSSGVWQRITTEHFELSTDLPATEAQSAAEQLERTRAALLAAAWNPKAGRKGAERASVVVLGNGLTFEHYFGRYVDGIFTPFVRPTFVLWGTPEHWEKRQDLRDESTTSTLRHELTHRLAAGIYGHQPRWFAEGLAQFIETIAIADDGASVILGRPNLAALRSYAKFRSVTVSDALAWKSDEGKDERDLAGLYGLSWLLVHWMYNAKPVAFAEYQKKLARGANVDEAWTTCFGELRPGEIDKQLFEYARFGQFSEVKRPLELSHAEVAKRSMTGADVEATLAQLAIVGARVQQKPALAEEGGAHVEQALSLEPANVLAMRLRMTVDPTSSVERWLPRLRAQVQKRPDDGEAWLFLGEHLGGRASASEREAALRRAVALLPGNARAYAALAVTLVGEGRGEEALPLATKASLLAPWDPRVFDTYAASLFAVGRCADAQRADMHAVDLVVEGERSLPESPGAKQRRKQYQAGCPKPAEPGGSEPPASAGEAPAGEAK